MIRVYCTTVCMIEFECREKVHACYEPVLHHVLLLKGMFENLKCIMLQTCNSSFEMLHVTYLKCTMSLWKKLITRESSAEGIISKQNRELLPPRGDVCFRHSQHF